MTKFKKQVVGVLATGVILAQVVSPLAVFATDEGSANSGTTLVITGNGEKSVNGVKVNTNQNTTVSQENDARVTNHVTSNSNSGGNTAKGTTGGNVVMDTGNATSNVNVENLLNKNVADVNCCDKGNTDVVIAGNGEQSKNTVTLDENNGNGKDPSGNSIYQNNYAEVENKVESNANSGDNKAKSITGGSVAILTGEATAKAAVSTVANANWANVGGNGNGGSTSLYILENGEKTTNKIDLDLSKNNTVFQDNDAQVSNYVGSDANSGENTVKGTAGGDILVDTGNAKSEADVENELNLNAAFVSCDCAGDLFAKVSGNGEISNNKIEADLGSDLDVWQGGEDYGNDADLDNCVFADAGSGDNLADSITGSYYHNGGSDLVEIDTGNADSKTSVENTANKNVFSNAGMPYEWPDLGVDFSFDVWHWHLGQS